MARKTLSVLPLHMYALFFYVSLSSTNFSYTQQASLIDSAQATFPTRNLLTQKAETQELASLINHLPDQNHVQEEYTCSFCEAKFPDKLSRAHHLKKHGLENTNSGREKSYFCTGCNKDFSSHYFLLRHLKSVTHLLNAIDHNDRDTYPNQDSNSNTESQSIENSYATQTPLKIIPEASGLNSFSYPKFLEKRSGELLTYVTESNCISATLTPELYAEIITLFSLSELEKILEIAWK